MKEVLQIIANIMNEFHELFIIISKKIGLDLSDKDLHFWTIGILGIITFLLFLVVFKWMSKWKWGAATIAFLYTLTLLVVLSFAIEIQQGITGEGNMEWMDIQIGLAGFFLFFGIYILIVITVILIKLFTKKKEKRANRDFNY